MKDWVQILDGKDVKPLEHGAVYDAVQEMAQKLGLGHIPVTCTESEYPGAKAVAYDNGAKQVRLNKGIIQATKSSLHSRATPELKAVIGHELAHLSRDMFQDRRLAKLPLYIGPVAAIAGYQIFKGLQKEVGPEEGKEQSPANRTIIGHLFGMNAQVGSWGLMGGMFTSAMMSRSKEFTCDRIGAELTTPNAMKNAINMIYDHREKVRWRTLTRTKASGFQ
jgi:Zn-dependent protease with chaperone function